jgi:hypothetical protein
MVLRHVVVPVMLLSFVSSSSRADGAVTAWTDVVVRVYAANGALPGTSRAALDHARKTLEGASIDVIWRMCSPESPAASPDSRCDVPMAHGELAIRIVRSPVPPRSDGTLPLGSAILDMRLGNGVLATIYIDRVEGLAHKAGADSRALLGRAIAHELGHLLLATTSHGPVGLMRAFWSLEEVRLGQPQDWTFAPAELAAMRHRAAARQRQALLAFGTK